MTGFSEDGELGATAEEGAENTEGTDTTPASETDGTTTPPTAEEAEHAKALKSLKLPPEVQEKIGQRIAQYTARAKTAEESAAALKTENETLRKENTGYKAKVTDDGYIAAANLAGTLPKFAEVEDLARAAKVHEYRYWKNVFSTGEENGGYNGPDERQVDVQLDEATCRKKAARYAAALDELTPDYIVRKREIGAKIKARLELGEYAESIGLKIGQKLAPAKAAPAGGKKPLPTPPDDPDGDGERIPPRSDRNATPPDFRQGVKDHDSFVDQIARTKKPG